MTDYPLPVFYSFRRCPYAMRARLALAVAETAVELREIELRDKPQAMLAMAPKGTVPVLWLANGEVIAESLDIMFWALRQRDPWRWLAADGEPDAGPLLGWNDGDFKAALDRYKYADRYPEQPALYYRRQGEAFLAELETRLNRRRFLCAERFTLADAAILPFIRQFAAVDPNWFERSPYPAVNRWLRRFTASALFASVMSKYQTWRPGAPVLIFAAEPAPPLDTFYQEA